MEKRIKIKSTSLNPLNEALQKLKLNDTIIDFTPVIVEADGKFTSILNTKDDFNPKDVGSAFETEELETEEQKETKTQLLNKAKDALKQTLTNSKELTDILQKIQDLAKDASFNTWEVNKEKNTATLKNKNAQIFKQNDNLCLSHNGKIEIFCCVKELHDWLEKNGYPLPGKDIIIHESVEIKEDNGRNWLDLLNKYNSEQKDKIDTTDLTVDNQPDILSQGLGKIIDKKTLQAYNHVKPTPKFNRSFLAKDNTEVEECGGACVGIAALGPAVAYTAVKKKTEDVKLQEAFESLIPDDTQKYPGKKELVNKFLTWYKRNKPSIETGKIKLPDDFEQKFDLIIEPTFLNNTTDSVSRIWAKLIEKRASEVATNISKAKNIPEDVVLSMLMNNPNQQFCDLISTELNSYIPDTEEYTFGKVQLIPGNSLVDRYKTNPNYQQRQNWQKAFFQSKLDGKVDKTEVMLKTFKDLKNFVKGTKDTPEFTEAMFESVKSYPWLNKLLNQRLTEDDSPADFATGNPISTSSTTTTTSSTVDTTPDINISDDLGGSSAPATPSFGDINIDTGGYSPDEAGEENIDIPIDAPEYKIIDVLMNDDNNDIKVKLQNSDTKETEIKDLEDIDV